MADNKLKVSDKAKTRKVVSTDNPEDLNDSLVNTGLNVIDSWDEGKSSKISNRHKSQKNVKPKKNSKSPERISRRSPIIYARSSRKFVSRWSRSPIRHSRSPLRRSGSPLRRSRSPRKCNSSPRRRSRSPGRNAMSHVRNAPKQHQNVRYESPNDAQKQIIFEKGKVAESGLVPPGMETEFELSTQCDIQESNENKAMSNTSLKFSPPPDRMRFSPPDHIEKKDKLKFSPPPKRSLSPFRRRSPSPHRRRSPLSRKRSLSPSRRSPNKKKSFLEEIQEKFAQKEKKSFLTEISEKLQLQSSKPAIIPYPVIQPNYTQMPPTSIQPNITSTILQQQSLYQSNLMQLGAQHGFHQQNFSQLVQQLPTFLPPQALPYNPTPQPVPVSVFPILEAPRMPNNQVELPRQNQTKQETAINFADKKITLTEYVFRTTPKASDKPVSIQTKIDVIKRCQEATSLLNRDIIGTGRFVFKRNPMNVEESEEHKNHRSHFLSLKWNQDIQSMAICLNRLMMKLDKKVLFEVSLIRDLESPRTERVDSSKKKEPIFEGTLNKKPPSAELKVVASERPIVQEPKKPVMKSFATQTEKIKCEDCEKRNKIDKSNTYMQTEEVLTYDISSQTHLDDVQKSPVKSILKNQSLAKLTPAQLLLEEENIKSKRQRFTETSLNERNPYEERSPYDSRYLNTRRPINISSNSFDNEPFDNRYPPEPMTVDRYDNMSSNANKLFDRERPIMSRSLLSKSVPFSNFDPSLNLDYGSLRSPASSSNWPPRRY